MQQAPIQSHIAVQQAPIQSHIAVQQTPIPLQIALKHLPIGLQHVLMQFPIAVQQLAILSQQGSVHSLIFSQHSPIASQQQSQHSPIFSQQLPMHLQIASQQADKQLQNASKHGQIHFSQAHFTHKNNKIKGKQRIIHKILHVFLGQPSDLSKAPQQHSLGSSSFSTFCDGFHTLSFLLIFTLLSEYLVGLFGFTLVMVNWSGVGTISFLETLVFG